MKSAFEKVQILSVGTAVPKKSFTQDELIHLLGIKSSKALRFFKHSHIIKRHLYLPTKNFNKKNSQVENTAQLQKRFKKNAVQMSINAVKDLLKKSKLNLSEIEMLCCVTSTGFIVPSLSVEVSLALGLKENCSRLDLVGMGCSAGLNGLNAVSQWCLNHPTKKALLICCEISSAIYCDDDSEESALVNSLFGDGCAAALLATQSNQQKLTPIANILDFESHLIPATQNLLRFDWDEQRNRFKFVVDKKTPVLLSQKIDISINKLLKKYNIKKEKIRFWVIHSGGEAILAGIEKKLNLSSNTLRHTRNILKNYGNISSASFLFSYSELIKEKIDFNDQFGIFLTMGPGLSIETALFQFKGSLID